MKKGTLLISAIIIFTAMLLTSCRGVGNVIKKKIPGGDIKIDESSGKIESGDSSMSFGENLKWPKEFMVNMPEPKGNVTAVVKDDKTRQCSVCISEMNKDDASDYAASLKKLGYSGGVEVSDSESIMFSGKASDGSEVVFLYNTTSKEGSVSYNPNKGAADSNSNSNTESNTNNGPVDLTDVAPWPKEFTKDIPELKGKIVSASNNNNYVSASLEYVEKKDFEAYIKQLKDNGYTIDADESASTDSIDFSAYNAKGEWVRAYLIIEGDITKVIVEMEKP